MTGFFITANGQPVKWERDKVDMFAYHLTVPQGVTQLEMKIDFLTPAALSASPQAARPAKTSRCSAGTRCWSTPTGWTQAR